MASVDDAYESWLKAATKPPPGKYAGEFFELIISHLYGYWLRPGELVVDCGANAGQHTFAMSACVGPSGRVVAIEALPERVRQLRDHIASNAIRNVTVVPKAIGKREGKARFKLVAGDDAYSGLQQRDLPAGLEQTVTDIDVDVTTLDTILRAHASPVRFIKLDLEGGELDALRGGEQTLRAHRPFVVFENGRENSARLYGYTQADWFAFFSALDYVVFDILARAFTPDGWYTVLLPWYYIAVPAGSEAERFVRQELATRIAGLHREFTAQPGSSPRSRAPGG